MIDLKYRPASAWCGSRPSGVANAQDSIRRKLQGQKWLCVMSCLVARGDTVIRGAAHASLWAGDRVYWCGVTNLLVSAAGGSGKVAGAKPYDAN